MRFEKWHGIGNAYLVMEQDDLPMEADAERVRRICHPTWAPAATASC